MSDESQHREDMDSLHALPLSIIPLRTAGLRRARLVKNMQLEGRVELFSGAGSGSGQIDPQELSKVFEFNDENGSDLGIMMRLSELPSYDVYSLRVSLRKAGINVDNHAALALSAERSNELAAYMRVFTRPLIVAIYGNEAAATVSDFGDIVRLFRSPEVAKAKKNLLDLSERLRIDVTSIPNFIADYGDVYLSLAYYQSCLDQITPLLSDFQAVTEKVKRDDMVKSDPALLRGCSEVQTKLENAAMQVSDVLDVFRISTENMWESIDEARYRTLMSTITSYHTRIGGGLCALTVKLKEWKRRFPTPGLIGPQNVARHIAGEMRQGMDRIEEIQFEDM